jgi:membrane glycosyltransferase
MKGISAMITIGILSLLLAPLQLLLLAFGIDVNPLVAVMDFFEPVLAPLLQFFVDAIGKVGEFLFP